MDKAAFEWVRALPGRVRRRFASTAFDSWSAYRIRGFVEGDHGRAYGLTPDDRRSLVAAFTRNVSEIPSGTSLLHHIALAQAMLEVPPEVRGDVIECGVWKGASTASLSLVCKRVGRRLLVCDSFEGLPDEGLQVHLAPHSGVYGYYQQGMFCGRLEEVQANVGRLGAVDVCTFVKGFFSDSLKQLRDPIAFAFLDVDLVSSTQDCLRYLWPLLGEGRALYTDDARDLDVVKVFFDDVWWRDNLGCSAPGYVGSGCGLPLTPMSSSLGYTLKLGPFNPGQWSRAAHLHYPERDSAARE